MKFSELNNSAKRIALFAVSMLTKEEQAKLIEYAQKIDEIRADPIGRAALDLWYMQRTEEAVESAEKVTRDGH